MTKQEKIELGRSKAEQHWKVIQTWDCWKFVTRADFNCGVSGKYSKPNVIVLYNENAEKYANRPIKKIECGFSNIENDAYFSKMIELVNLRLMK